MPKGSNDDLRLLLALLIGFVTFSLPLLANDTKHLWMSRRDEQHHGGNDDYTYPPGPPWNYYNHDDNDPGYKFRQAITEGNLDDAEQLYTASMAADPPVNLATKAHWHGSTPIFEAARQGHLHAAKWLVARGADPDTSNEWGDSAANEAASMGHWDIVWYLADQGANLTRTSDHAHSSLVLSAVRHRATDALAQLQRRDVDLSARHWNGNTVLHEAARMGEAKVLSWLLEHTSLDVNATNDSEEGALAEAATMGHTDAMWSLIKAGASLGEPGSVAAGSLFHSAVRHTQIDLLSLMLERGAIGTAAISQVDQHGRYPLVEAVRAGSEGTVDWLLEHGCNVSGVSDSGDSAVAAAAFDDKFAILWKLIEKGADVHATNEFGGSLLMSAVHYGHKEDALRLLEPPHSLDVNRHNHRGDTPLTLAASSGNMDLVQLLLDRGASATAQGERRDTPLIRAAKFRRAEVVQFFLAKQLPGLSVDDANRAGDTALLEASRSGNVHVATQLLDAGANLSHANQQGMTALLEAAESGSFDLVETLVERGADVHQRSRHGEGALELSRWARNADEIKEFLVARGVVDHTADEDHYHDEHDSEHGYPGYRGDDHPYRGEHPDD